MRAPGAASSASWKAARIGATAGSSMAPPMSCRSMANEAMSCSLLALTSFAIESSGPGVSPRDSAVMVRKRV